MRHIRFSALPRIAKCRATVAAEEDARRTYSIPSEIGNDATALGHAYHAAAELAAHAGSDAAELQLGRIAVEHGVPEADLRDLWRRVTPQPELGAATTVEAEQALEVQVTPALTVRGTADLVRWWDRFGLVEVTDWKTGYAILDEEDGAESHAQLLGYTAAAALLMQRAGRPVERARGVIQAVRRGGEPDVIDLARTEIDDAWSMTARLAVEADAQRDLEPGARRYRTGRHCRFCLARRDCRAYRSEMESAVALVSEIGGGVVTTENAERIYEARVLLSKATESLDAALKDAVETLGPIPSEDGKRELTFRAYQRKPSVNEEAVKAAFEAVSASIPGARLSILDVQTLVLHALETRERVEARRFGLYKVETS